MSDARKVSLYEIVASRYTARMLRILTLIDEYTKQALAIHVGYSVRAVDAITVLEACLFCVSR